MTASSVLPILRCPSCGEEMTPQPGVPLRPATSYDTCHRRCSLCEIGASNGRNASSVTFVYKDPLASIPAECRDGALETLARALNVRSRDSKKSRFGFVPTSEDAATWVAFTYLRKAGLLLEALRSAGVRLEPVDPAAISLLLWGSPVEPSARGQQIRDELERACRALREAEYSFTEPDVVIDLGEAGVVIAEVKLRSGNEVKDLTYAGWARYTRSPAPAEASALMTTRRYELTRNWCVLDALAGERNGVLVNLGPPSLFAAEEKKRLAEFALIAERPGRRFVTAVWPDLLGPTHGTAPPWFDAFCRARGLVGAATRG